ncbi:NmrA family NAD(P)-binding protein [Lacisediminihabitans sp. H27-G8]|uniref:NmrA family NAD(P)-binding protein n=1 Tax=Lacisediminihabitans sp. H27-G8 TaxID=3111909 RepID=UPI0038FCA888
MILVTTAGKVGSESARLMADAGHGVRVLTRNPDAHAALAAAGVEVVEGDLNNPSSIAKAVQGVASIVLVTPPNAHHEIGVITAVRGTGIHVTKVTADASADSPIARRRDHFRIEQALTSSGLPYTLVRANAYMQNFLALAPVIARTSTFSSPTGDGRVGMVDARDVAAMLATIATSPARHTDRTYRASGPESLSYDDVAVRLSKVLGRTITHDHISVQDQVSAMVQMGMPEGVARANAQALRLFADGDSDWLSTNVEDVTGRRASPFTQFATDYRLEFIPN